MHSLPFVCFACRKSFKITWCGFSPGKNDPGLLGRSCPQCAGSLRYMGRYFKTPPKSSLHQWRKVVMLFEKGWRADDLRGGPKTLSEVSAFLQTIEERSLATLNQARKRSKLAAKRRRSQQQRYPKRRNFK